MIYVEVFGGGGSVLLNKERSVREVLNDANGNLINLYRVVREHPEELKDRLLYVLHSREDFKIAQRRLAQFSYKDDILRAADFYQVVRQSYVGNGKVRFAYNCLLHRPALLFYGGLLPRQHFPAVRSPAACDNSAECRGPLAAVLQPVPGGVGAVPAAWHLH